MATARIDVKRIQDIALLGVRRAAVFMGLGMNAARDSRLREYELAHITGIELVPAGVDEKTIDHFKHEFQLWIIESGFRELLERFALFLDSIHHHSLLLALNRKKITSDDAEKLHRKFEYAGIGGKLQQLEGTFGMSFEHAHYLETLAQARNCLTHRLGTVGDKDCSADGHFELRWRSFDLLADAPDREEPINLSLPIREPVYFAEGGILQIQIVDRVLRFAKGEKLALSSKDLAEICHFVIMASNDVSRAMIDYAQSIGIPEDNTQPSHAADG
jgi:hypothetical protein